MESGLVDNMKSWFYRFPLGTSYPNEVDIIAAFQCVEHFQNRGLGGVVMHRMGAIESLPQNMRNTMSRRVEANRAHSIMGYDSPLGL